VGVFSCTAHRFQSSSNVDDFFVLSFSLALVYLFVNYSLFWHRRELSVESVGGKKTMKKIWRLMNKTTVES